MSKNKLLIVIFFISILPFINTISNGYSLDDDFVTEVNSTTKGFSSLKEIFTTHYIENKAGYSYEYRPIVKLSFVLEHQFFGVKPRISHFFNVIFYGLFCVILFQFLVSFFENKYKNVVFFSVVLFSVLPIHTEVVASLKNRDILLSGIFGLLAGIQVLHEKRSLYGNLLAAVFMFLSFGSKQDALALLVIIMVLLFLKENEISIKKKSVIGMFLVLGYIVFWITKKNLISSAANRTINYYENPLVENANITDFISTVFFTIGFYTKQIVLPIKMSCYYGYDFTDFSSFSNLITICGVLIFFFMVYLLFKNRFKEKIILVSLLFIAVFFAMYSNVFVRVPGVVADRFAFFPSIGFSLLVVFFIINDKFSDTIHINQLQSFKVPSIVVLIILIIISFNRNKDWKDRITLFTIDSQKYPKSYKLLTMLATEQIQRANNPKLQLSQQERQMLAMNAFQNFQKANSIYNRDYETLNNLGYFEMNFNRNYPSALMYFQSSLKENSKFPDVYFNMGIVYKKLNQSDSSVHYFKTCIAKFPEFLNAYNYLADAYFNQGLKQKLEALINFEMKNNLPNEMIQNHRTLLLKMNTIKE